MNESQVDDDPCTCALMLQLTSIDSTTDRFLADAQCLGRFGDRIRPPLGESESFFQLADAILKLLDDVWQRGELGEIHGAHDPSPSVGPNGHLCFAGFPQRWPTGARTFPHQLGRVLNHEHPERLQSAGVKARRPRDASTHCASRLGQTLPLLVAELEDVSLAHRQSVAMRSDERRQRVVLRDRDLNHATTVPARVSVARPELGELDEALVGARRSEEIGSRVIRRRST
jgi:hypothetical protein